MPEVNGNISLFDFLSLRPVRDPLNSVVKMATNLTWHIINGLGNFVERGALFNGHFHPPDPWVSPIWRWMTQDGWCRSELARLFGQLPLPGLLFLYNMKRPRDDESHPMIRIRKQKRQLKEDKYKTKHVDGCLGCKEIAANKESLRLIIEKDKVPLILSIDEEDSNTEIFFVEGEPDLHYVAISHVWSDGLGNLDGNALPRCQLLRLSNMVRNLTGKHEGILLFWCDTICIPPDSADMKDTQDLALGQMRNIYANASVVLVLDSWLFNDTMENKSDLEILMKIVCCGWNTRLWTYQEGALAKSLLFQFLDGAYDIDDGKVAIDRSASLLERISLGHALSDRVKVLRNFREQANQLDRLSAAAAALAHRTTSVASDEALCLAVLLDLNVTEIARADPALRMEKFWKMLPEVPQHFLGINRACMLVDGLHWAPRTFLASTLNKTRWGLPDSWEAHNMTIVPVKRTDLGLSLCCPGIRIEVKDNLIAGVFKVRISKGIWFHVGIRNTSKRYGYFEIGILNLFYNNEEDRRLSEVSQRVKPSRQVKGLHGLMAKCVLVGIEGDKNGVIHCRKLGTCNLEMRDSPGLDELMGGGKSMGFGIHGDLLAVDGTLCQETQHWYLG
ncbi:unnamed protein product [Clonostachys rosea]|uniref:Heterokaryon incompatibility domain-containing protein n=1 Tax=Bionectria ochroleuca TaxID=29856 RepID=A0ABY6TNX0_BIOOC|nr:unnamed protein product [Clonostachys rosea]